MVVEDHKAQQLQICSLLKRHPERQIIGGVSNGLETVQRCSK